MSARAPAAQVVRSHGKSLNAARPVQPAFVKGLGMPTLPSMRTTSSRTSLQINAIFTKSKTKTKAAPAPAPVEIEDPVYQALASKPAAGLAWAALIAWAFVGAPQGTSELDAELVQGIFTQGPFSPEVNPLMFAEFNAFGIVSASFATMLAAADDEDQPAPLAPFAALSLFVGMFTMGPYLLLRQPRTTPGSPTKATAGFLGNYFDQKANQYLIGAWAVLLAGYTVATAGGAGVIDGYVEILKTDQLFSAALVDTLLLSVMIYAPLKEDMVRRGVDESKAPLYMFPVVGPAIYYATRPSLEE